MTVSGFTLAPGRENLKTFSKQPHLLSGLRGPLAVEGGITGADRSLQPAVLLPLEKNGPLFNIAPQPPEAQQVDVLNVFADSSRQDLTGALSATALTGLGNWLTGLTGTSAILLGIVLGLMMCFDLGGPINKAAYVFAATGLAAGTVVHPASAIVVRASRARMVSPSAVR